MEFCELCEREVFETSRHHLIPLTTQKRVKKQRPELIGRFEETINLCKSCHKTIHMNFEEYDLAHNLNTKEELKAHPELAKFISWLGRQSHGFEAKVLYSGRKWRPR